MSPAADPSPTAPAPAAPASPEPPAAPPAANACPPGDAPDSGARRPRTSEDPPQRPEGASATARPSRYYAHTATGPDGKLLPESEWQPLATHLRNVAELARQFAEPFGAGDQAYLAGLLHDLGKYAERFQARLHDPRIRGINHWASGARVANDLYSPPAAYAVDGHHTGLPAYGDLRQAMLRMSDPALRLEHTGCAEAVGDMLDRMRADGLESPSASRRTAPSGAAEQFAAALHTRMLFSALVDADFLDTERHFDPPAAAQRPAAGLDATAALALLNDHLGRLPSGGPLHKLRRRLLDECRDAASQRPGLFTLTAPTGSGKTLASLAFALSHIALFNRSLAASDSSRLRRVIVVIPYTSIIEQTAGIFRAVFARFGTDFVLEHHSAAAPFQAAPEREDAEDLCERRRRLAAENWAAPIVVTTSVQFFESLFASRPAACRKLHNIARSVILFDEVQTLPPRLVPSLLSAVRLLASEPYGCSTVFMTATQPAFETAREALPFGWEPRPIGSGSALAAAAPRRTRIVLPSAGEAVTWQALAAHLAAYPQVLCVVNTTRQARELFRLLPPENRVHLSARLCPAHRQQRLALVSKRLAAGHPCQLVSTQLVEAGVDLDFPIAFRALGPLDSLIQTAGRCNREGRQDQPAPVIVFRPEDNVLPPGAYATASALTEAYLAAHPEAAERLDDPAFYAPYFAKLYNLLGRDSVAGDPAFTASCDFGFPAVAQACQLIGEATQPVLVQWGDGPAVIERARRERHLRPADRRYAQRYSINLLWGEFRHAQARGYVAEAAPDIWGWNSQYDEDLGACHAEASQFIN